MAHPGKQLLFVLLSVADLALTCWLLERSGGEVYEANPAARWWLDRHGWYGLAGFKAVAVAVVLALTAAIARTRPRAAGAVLTLACVALAAVLLHSTALSWTGTASTRPEALERELAALNRQAQEGYQRREEFRRLLTTLAGDLAAGRCTLRQAVARAAASDWAGDPAWQRQMAVTYPGRAADEAFALCLLRHAVRSLENDAHTAWAVSLRLERDFLRTYGSAPPLDHRPDLRASAGPGTTEVVARRAWRSRARASWR